MLLSAILLAAAVHYDVVAAIDRQRGTVDARVTIQIANAPPKTVFVIGNTYSIANASAKHATITIDRTDDWQEITVRNTTPTLTMRTRSSGPLAPTGTPPINLITRDLVELNLDSLWVPLEKGFGTRFTLDATITGIPSEMEVVAPGRITRIRNGFRIHRDVEDIDVAFVAMRGLKRVGAPGLELYAIDPDSPAAANYRKHGAGALLFLQSWFGAMQGAPTRIVVVRRERKSGYARRGYIVVTEQSAGTEAGSAKFVAHELAHAWWSPADPTTEHRWLQESIAEYVALRYVESAFGVQARDVMLARKRETAASATPLLGRGARTDAELYAKGPVLLFELESRIGREKLDQVLRNLAPHPPSVTAQFMEALAEVAGAEAASEFERRLRE